MVVDTSSVTNFLKSNRQIVIGFGSRSFLRGYWLKIFLLYIFLTLYPEENYKFKIYCIQKLMIIRRDVKMRVSKSEIFELSLPTSSLKQRSYTGWAWCKQSKTCEFSGVQTMSMGIDWRSVYKGKHMSCTSSHPTQTITDWYRYIGIPQIWLILTGYFYPNTHIAT